MEVTDANYTKNVKRYILKLQIFKLKAIGKKRNFECIILYLIKFLL